MRRSPLICLASVCALAQPASAACETFFAELAPARKAAADALEAVISQGCSGVEKW
jgi:hypothetical protein